MPLIFRSWMTAWGFFSSSGSSLLGIIISVFLCCILCVFSVVVWRETIPALILLTCLFHLSGFANAKLFLLSCVLVTDTQFSLSHHSSSSCSMSESHLEAWRELVWFSSFEKGFLPFVQSGSWRLYWGILSSSGSPPLWSPTIIVDEGRRILTDHSWHAPLHTEYPCTRGCSAFALAPYSSRFTGWNISAVSLKFAE